MVALVFTGPCLGQGLMRTWHFLQKQPSAHVSQGAKMQLSWAGPLGMVYLTLVVLCLVVSTLCSPIDLLSTSAAVQGFRAAQCVFILVFPVVELSFSQP
jgi:hypothetical protein